MTEKREIIRELGEKEILLPALVNAALLANDRIKYYFTLIQTAVDHAEDPGGDQSNLRAERELAEIDDFQLDDVVCMTVKSGPSAYHLEHADEILGSIARCMKDMIQPFLIDGNEDGKEFSRRFKALTTAMTGGHDGIMTRQAIDRITSGNRGKGDSLHLLVMDVHKALNQLQGKISQEQIDGAVAYLLKEQDRVLVRAFMAGLNRTSPLKFDHPGLGTTATRAGKKLLIQNDIGLTEAHVLVITIAGKTVTITYTDVHMQRLQFFQSLCEKYGVKWSDTLSKTPGGAGKLDIYHLSTGTFTAKDLASLREFLTHFGSRIVFLIDWNRARKRLRNFLPNTDAVAVLKWAADQDIGHVGFLQLGGERLIYDALELSPQVPLRYGEPLHQILGKEKTREYLQWVLKTSTRGLLSNTSKLLLQDEIRAELLRYFRSTHEEVMEMCEEHASFTIEVATVVVESLQHIRQGADLDKVSLNARRAKEWERNADELVNRVRNLSRRIEGVSYFTELINTADDAMDFLEEACFYTTLAPCNPNSNPIHAELCNMADIAMNSGREFLKALIAALYVHKTNNRDDMQEFLRSVDSVVNLERVCDEVLRKTEKTVFEQSDDHKELWLYLEIASNIEESTNSMMKAAFILRDNVLQEVNR